MEVESITVLEMSEILNDFFIGDAKAVVARK
jgi:hypothetical protein